MQSIRSPALSFFLQFHEIFFLIFLLYNRMFVSVSEFFYKKIRKLFGFLIPPPIFAKNYQRNDNECYNS